MKRNSFTDALKRFLGVTSSDVKPRHLTGRKYMQPINIAVLDRDEVRHVSLSFMALPPHSAGL